VIEEVCWNIDDKINITWNNMSICIEKIAKKKNSREVMVADPNKENWWWVKKCLIDILTCRYVLVGVGRSIFCYLSLHQGSCIKRLSLHLVDRLIRHIQNEFCGAFYVLIIWY